MIFPKIPGLCQKLAHTQNLQENLEEVYMSNFLTVMEELKSRIKAGTLKNRYNRISELSLVKNTCFPLLLMIQTLAVSISPLNFCSNCFFSTVAARCSCSALNNLKIKQLDLTLPITKGFKTLPITKGFKLYPSLMDLNNHKSNICMKFLRNKHKLSSEIGSSSRCHGVVCGL